MKKMFLSSVLLIFFFFAINAQQLSFPGAEGAGRFTTGGRGGSVYEVTNLLDDGAGSLRYGLESVSGKRTIVFRVAGYIPLSRTLTVSKGDVTIAGQTAPGDGICLKNYGFEIKANNVIIRYMRFRPGDVSQTEVDALSGRFYSDIIIDHCTSSWSIDEISSFYDNSRFTMQWCLMSESINRSIIYETKGDHGFTGIWGGKMATFHHNLAAHSKSRNPRLCGSRYSALPDQEIVDVRNNVFFNYPSNCGYAGEGGRFNFINNYYKPGPATTSSTIQSRIFAPNPDTGTNNQNGVAWGKFFLSGNYVFGNSAVTNDNLLGLHPSVGTFTSVKGPAMTVTLTKADYVMDAEIPVGTVETQTALIAYNNIMDNVGASLVRDSVDRRIIREVKSNTYTFTGSRTGMKGIIDSQQDVGGWPELKSGTSPTDSDHDGMPDAWETAHNLNPNNAADRNTVASDGYTMLEKYLNSIEFNYPVTGYELTKKTSTSFELKWRDNYLAEEGFTIERSVDDGVFTELDQLPKYSNTYTDNYAPANKKVTYRVIAYNNDVQTPRTTSISYEPSTSVNDVILNTAIKSYPNPFSEFVTFELSTSGRKIESVKLFDLSGKLTAVPTPETLLISDNKVVWNDSKVLGKINSGVYLCVITFDNKQTSRVNIFKK